MKKILATAAVLGLPWLLWGSEGAEAGRYLAITGRENDFVPRLFNFLIFAALAYYLVADPIRNFFANRSKKIAGQLQEIERKLQEAKEARKNAEQALSESGKKVEEILKDTSKEIELLVQRYRELGEKELQVLEQQFKERIETEERKMRRETIRQLLDENLSPEDIPLTAHRLIDAVAKKVA